jgi:hypothetical protein
MPKPYPATIINEVKRLFVQEGKSPRDIEKIYDGNPTHQTIENWAKKENRDGKTWYALRDDWRDDQYNAISPKALASKIISQISGEMSSDNFSADRLAKLVRALERITEATYQLPAMYEMLTDFLAYLKQHYPHLLTEDLVAAVREFKNSLRGRLK